MSTKLSKKTLDDVLLAIPMGPGVPPRVIFERMGMWSLNTTRHALSELHRLGAVRADGKPGEYLYRRTP